MKEHFVSYINNTHKFEYLSYERELDLATRSKNGDLLAREQLITSHLRIVSNIARRFSKKNTSYFEDLVQEGNLGLMYAVDNFDHTKNNRFAAYAKWWVKEFIKRKFYKNIYMFSTPFRVIQKSFQVKNDPLSSLDKEKKKGENIAIRDITKTPVYLGDMVYSSSKSSEGFSMESIIKDPNQNVEKNYEHNSFMKEIKGFMKNNLTEKEQIVINNRFFISPKKTPYKDISDILHVSAETVRNIEKSALDKLRNNLK